ncbi:guanine nucleotide-binding protein alpha-4 subunit [Mycena maculata]|uniref:Guanine nucleotide-binding protein alpha-4 subunit n=1 Tax=Mycena maculata TaxID=230809 RepID=A0AAD7IQ03_9AGAR|nr:guanine nucleotide-binding protein alpha-4 subunit [Mycena maculata]
MPPPDESPDAANRRIAAEEHARRVSAAIDAAIRAERQAQRKKRIVRLLLLGQSESGKSTTLRQFQRLYTPTRWRAERREWRGVVHLNVVRSVLTILEALGPGTSENSASGRKRRGSGATSMLATLQAGPSSSTQALEYAEYTSHAEYHPTNNYTNGVGNGVDSDPESPDYDSDPDGHCQGRFAHSPPASSPPGIDVEALRLRLLPLRHVEALLIARLVPPGGDAFGPVIGARNGSGELQETGRDREREVFVRPGNRWKMGQGKSPEREAPDTAQTTLHACAPAMSALWRDPFVRAVLRKRKIRLEEGPGFFLNDLERVTGLGYLPTDDDVLRARLKTVGVAEYTFEMEVSTGRETGTEWRIVDVGGSRSQATWVPFFDDVDAIIFLAPISGFDQVLAEDRGVNRLEDSVLLWKAVCSNKLLASVDLVLFLNKCDILERKLKAGVKLARYVRSYADRENN